jgi:V/A-type H+-transporting ATPase subunit E
MNDDLQKLLERIQKEGVDEASAKADALLQDARRKADAIAKQAEQDAAARRDAAERDAAAFQQRAEQAVKQSARDLLLRVEHALAALFERVLAKEVDEALADAGKVAPLALEAVRAYLSGGEKAVDLLVSAKAPALAEALRAQLAAAAAEGVKVSGDGGPFTGFRLRLDGGRVEHDFTGAAVTEALCAGLRPQIAQLLQGEAKQQDADGTLS